MMENTIVMVMQTCQTYGEKMKTHGLAEFEVLMYEQCCRMVETFAKIHDRMGKMQLMDLERALYEKELKFKEWEATKDDSSDDAGTGPANRKPDGGDGETDPGSAGSPVPVG